MRQHTATLAAAVLAAAITPQVHAENRCVRLSEVAEATLTARYGGMRARELLQEQDSEAIRAVIIAAYKVPYVDGAERQAHMARRYGDLIYVQCEEMTR